MNKKGLTIGSLLPVGLTIGIAIVGISITAEILSQVRSTQTADSAAYNLSTSGLSGIGKFGSWFPIIVTVAVAVIVIGLLMYFRGRE